MSDIVRGALLGLAAATVLACGSDEVPVVQASPEPERVAAPTATENSAPEIRDVHLEPVAPLANGVVRAVVDVRVGSGATDEPKLDYVWSVAGRALDSKGPEINVPETVSRGSEIRVVVRARQGRQASDPMAAEITVGNSAPEWRTFDLSHEGEVARGTTVVARPVVVDADLDPLEYEVRWMLNDEIVHSGPSFDTSELRRGDTLRAIVSATDGEYETEERVSEAVTIANSGPKIVSAPPRIGADGRIRYEIEATDPDGDRRFRYEVAQGPPNVELDSIDGVLTWQAEAKHVGSHAVEIVVRDLYGGEARQRFELTVSEIPEEVPAAPAEDAEDE